MKTETTNYTLCDALSGGFTALEELRDELQEWYDNLPDSFQNGDKGDQIQEAVAGLEDALGYECGDVPEELSFLEAEAFQVTLPVLRKRATKSDRCGWAQQLLTEARGFLEERANSYREYADDAATPTTRPDGEQGAAPFTQAEFAAAADAAESFVEVIGDCVDGAGNMDFPGAR